MNRVKKVISVILSAIMVVSMFAICASAAISPCYWYDVQGIERGRGTLDEAIAEVEPGGLVICNKDIVIGEEKPSEEDKSIMVRKPVEITKSFRLQCEEDKICSLKRAEGYTGELFVIKSGRLSLKRIVVDGCGEDYVNGTKPLVNVVGGTLELNSKALLRNNNSGSNNGGAIAVNSASAGRDKARVIINDGSQITNCNAASGGAVYVTGGGALTMNGGLINENIADFDGGAISVTGAPSSATIAGGIITDNNVMGTDVTNVGSAIAYNDGTTGQLTGGKIMGNTCEYGAVYVGKDSQVSVGGTAYVFENFNHAGDNKNIYLPGTVSAQPIGVVASFEKGAKVGISFNAQYGSGTDDTVVDFISPNGLDINSFIWDDATNYAYFMDGRSAVHRCPTLVVHYDVEKGSVDVDTQVFRAGFAYDFLPIPDGVTGKSFKGWADDSGKIIKATDKVPADFYEVTFTAQFKSSSPFAFIGAFFEKLAELMQIAFRFLQNMFMGGADKQI